MWRNVFIKREGEQSLGKMDKWYEREMKKMDGLRGKKNKSMSYYSDRKTSGRTDKQPGYYDGWRIEGKEKKIDGKIVATAV